jgi:Sec-independent protein secretion pathway component TatC
MVKEAFRDKPFYYKLLSTLLRIASGVVIILVAFFAIRFFMETPFYRMFDGISISQIIRMALVLVVVICLLVALRKSLAGGIATSVPIIAYTVLESIEYGTYTAGAINYIMLGIAVMYIIMGILKRHLEHDRMEDIMGPKIEKNEGPDLMDLHL